MTENTIPKWASVEISNELATIREVGENQNVEFKEGFPEDARKLKKEIAAMASSGGGKIFIGINDNCELCGLEAKNDDERDDIFERADNIARTVKPIPIFNLYFAIESDFTILVIEIPKEQDEPVFYSDGKPYVRDKRKARPAEPHEVVELVWKHPSSEHKKELERLELKELQRKDQMSELQLEQTKQSLKLSQERNKLSQDINEKQMRRISEIHR